LHNDIRRDTDTTDTDTDIAGVNESSERIDHHDCIDD
jgi:hypothetical protein